MTTDELIDYYADLLIVQYAAKPAARATVQAYAREAVADLIAAKVRDGFAIGLGPGLVQGDAVGAQVDILAAYRGAQRLVYGLDLSHQYFTMPDYGAPDADTAAGFANYGSTVAWQFLTYQDANRPLYALTDDELARLTQFRARVQSRSLTMEEVDEILFDFFGTNVGVFESGAMQITYIDLISDTDPLFGVLNQTQSLPRPAGVRATAIRSETLGSLFGFDYYGVAPSGDFVGFGLYGSPQAGSFARYP